MSSKRTYEYVDYGCRLIHPQSCGSSVRWTINVHKQYGRVNKDVTVSLTDCDRGIKWCGYGSSGLQEMREKIEGAIAELDNALGALRAAEAHCEKIPSKKKSK